MNELATMIEDNGGIKTVNARDLHEFLENKRQFADWIKQRIEQYGFNENLDFTIHKFVNGKSTQIDYHISIQMAKELSMVENNEKGKQARKYFIEVERKFKEENGQIKPMSVTELFELQLKIMKEHQARLENVEKDIKEIKENKVMLPVPGKVEDELITPTELGQILSPKKSAVEVNNILRDLGYQYKVNGQWVASIKANGLTFTTPVQLNNGKIVYQMYWKRKVYYSIQNLFSEVAV